LGSKVEELPGFEGPLPFELETGYIGLGERDDDMQVFYYFIKSENDPAKDPLLLWLTGGPGCSSFSGLAFQIGPLAFKTEKYDGNMPNLVLRPQSWTKVSSIIFVDLPLGTGFSYAKNLTANRSDWKLIHHTHQFLRKWLIDHPEFLLNDFYMGGDSYSGIAGPAIVQEISKGNEIGLQPPINLQVFYQFLYTTLKSKLILRYFQGYLLGNPITTKKEKNDQIPFAHGMGLISDELYECLSGISTYNILDRYCKADSTKKHEGPWTRSLTQNGDHDAIVPFMSTQAWIRALNYSIVEDWRPWHLENQIAGYTRRYSNQMTFATVKDSGHTAPEYKPDEGYAMFTRWIANKPL
ncbi:hypothetical protein V8G54_010894, partial [Vigna mungo]